MRRRGETRGTWREGLCKCLSAGRGRGGLLRLAGAPRPAATGQAKREEGRKKNSRAPAAGFLKAASGNGRGEGPDGAACSTPRLSGRDRSVWGADEAGG